MQLCKTNSKSLIVTASAVRCFSPVNQQLNVNGIGPNVSITVQEFVLERATKRPLVQLVTPQPDAVAQFMGHNGSTGAKSSPHKNLKDLEQSWSVLRI